MKTLLKNAWHWKTLLLGIVIFYILAFGANLVKTVVSTTSGGCAGCLPDGKGGVTCVNECPSDPNDVVILIVLLVVSYGVALVLVEWRSRIKASSFQQPPKL